MASKKKFTESSVCRKYSSTHKVSEFRPKGNRFLRDIAEDDETDLDRDSMHPIHEQTHNSKNHKEFNNVTESLKQVRLPFL